jgi:hypothetical protein
MIDHPGFKAWNRYDSYHVSLRIFNRTVPDLLRAIQRFETSLEDGILDRTKKEDLEDIEGAIQKELFAVTNAAHSLVDHARRLQKELQIVDYEEMRAKCFGEDRLHDFVIGLRTLLHHLDALEAGWNITNDFKRGKTASFVLHRKELQLAVDQSTQSFSVGALKQIREYIAAAHDVIDLKLVFHEYQKRVTHFHNWFGEQLVAGNFIALRDYERCIKENRNRSSRTIWKALIGNWLNWKEPPNPYTYLPRFLSAEQLAEIHALPMQSKEQIDRVIQLVDQENACDTVLREQIHLLFQRASSALSVVVGKGMNDRENVSK